MQTTIYHAKFDKTFTNDIINKLKKGAIGIFPTDTVYGIGCDALHTKALQNLYHIKKRDLSKPINVLVSNIDMVQKFVINVHPLEKLLMEKFWPGALTVILDKSSIVPDILTAGLNTIGIRMPNHKLCLKIIEQFGSPLAMSSANLSDKQPITNLGDILNYFDTKVDFVMDGGTIANGVPSTIVKVENNEIIKILREGSITAKEIETQLGGNIKCLKI